VFAFGRGGADLGGFCAPAGHADVGRAVDDRSDPGGRSFGGNVEGGAGMLRLELFRQLRNQFGPERVGAFDDQAIRVYVGQGCSQQP
jgi:hypothetical protein